MILILTISGVALLFGVTSLIFSLEDDNEDLRNIGLWLLFASIWSFASLAAGYCEAMDNAENAAIKAGVAEYVTKPTVEKQETVFAYKKVNNTSKPEKRANSPK